MARPALGLGEIGEVKITPQVRRDGRWVAAKAGSRAGRYRARAYYRGFDGVRRDVVATASSRVRADAALHERVEEILRGADDVTLTSKSSFVTAGRAWLAYIARSDSGLSERTVSDYTRTFDRCIDAAGSSLRGLTISQANNPQRLRAFLQRVAEDRGTGAAKICRSVIGGILSNAVDNGVLEASAILQVRAVKAQTPKASIRDHDRALTREERDEIIAFADKLATAESLDPRTQRKRQSVADLIAFMAGTGARIEEARSMLWSFVNLDDGTCEIRGTKTDSSLRRVGLPPWLHDRLMRRAESGGEGLVFSSPAHLDDPWKPWDQSNSAGAVRKVLDDSGFGWAVPHTFRRTVATLLDDAGVPIRRISDQLGHKDTTMTARVYLGRDFGSDKADLAALL